MDIRQCDFLNQVERTWQRPMWTLLSFTILGRAWPETDFKDLQGLIQGQSWHIPKCWTLPSGASGALGGAAGEAREAGEAGEAGEVDASSFGFVFSSFPSPSAVHGGPKKV